MFLVQNIKNGIIVIKGETYAELDFLVQPIVDTISLEIRYFEVLSRVSKHSGERLESEDFFSDIDDEFIKLVSLHQICYFQKKNIEKKFCINLTMSSLFDDAFVCKLLKFKIKNFIIEINHVCQNVDSDILYENITKLQKAGIQFWLDDYYHEYNNANLSFGLIPWDRIKIYKSILHYNSDSHSLIESICFVLKPFCKDGLIFEGIESSFQHDLIKNNNILGQGYYYSYPKTLESFREKFQLSQKKNNATY